MSGLKCPVCCSDNVYEYFYLRKNDLIAQKCTDCSHVFVQNSPISSSNAADYYTMDDFDGNRKLQSNELYTNYYCQCRADYRQFLQSSQVLRQFKEKINYLNDCFPSRGRLLDVGCATGVFLDMAREEGWAVEGVEISPDLASYAREQFSLKVHLGDLIQQELCTGPFDVISMFDVIEHLPDVNAIINACAKLVKKDGFLMLRTPTEKGLLRDIAKMIYRSSFTKMESPMFMFYSFEHIQSFSLKSLTHLLEGHNFTVQKVFREEESIGRVNVPWFVKGMVSGINLVSLLINKQHKMTVVAQKK